MPRPVSTPEEAKINMREEIYQNIFDRYLKENCNNKGQQQPNLSKSEMRGIAKLKERIKKNQVLQEQHESLDEEESSTDRRIRKLKSKIEDMQAMAQSDPPVSQNKEHGASQHSRGGGGGTEYRHK